MNFLITHILPINDISEHTERVYYEPSILPIPFSWCKCNPEIRLNPQASESILIIHNSFDGREGVEWVQEILKENKLF